MADFLDIGHSRRVAWADRPRAAALLVALADPDRGFDAVVGGEYERAIRGNQLLELARLLDRHCVGRAAVADSGQEDLLVALGERAEGRLGAAVVVVGLLTSALTVGAGLSALRRRRPCPGPGSDQAQQRGQVCRIALRYSVLVSPSSATSSETCTFAEM